MFSAQAWELALSVLGPTHAASGSLSSRERIRSRARRVWSDQRAVPERSWSDPRAIREHMSIAQAAPDKGAR